MTCEPLISRRLIKSILVHELSESVHQGDEQMATPSSRSPMSKMAVMRLPPSPSVTWVYHANF